MESRELGQSHEQPSTTSNLPQDIILFHILPLLPLLHVSQLRCVNKTWYNFLKKQHFLHLHRLSNRQIMIKYRSVSKEIIFQSLEFDETCINLTTTMQTHAPPDPAQIFAGSCNRLILLQNPTHRRFSLWSPATKQARELPKLPCNPKPKGYVQFSGIGLDPITGDYKVLVRYNYEHKSKVVHVYTHSTKTWRVDPKIMPNSLLDIDNRESVGVFVGGFLYWWMKRRRRGNDVILRFDIALEKFKVLQAPNRNGVINCVCGLDGLLCAVYVYESVWDLWLMKGDGDNEYWTKFMTVPKLTTCGSMLIQPLCFTHNGGGLVLQYGGHIIYHSREVVKGKHYFKSLFNANSTFRVESIVFGKTTTQIM